jgi:hypothetical protein
MICGSAAVLCPDGFNRVDLTDHEKRRRSRESLLAADGEAEPLRLASGIAAEEFSSLIVEITC